MMTILMIDVEAGKEDLFERLTARLRELSDSEVSEKIQFLYMAKCYTHSDISLMVEVKDPEALPSFITNILLQLDGVWDIQLIPLLNPKFFDLPPFIIEGDLDHFTVTLDVKSTRTRAVYNTLTEMAASADNAISFLAYSFYSYENDIILTFLAPDMAEAGKFVQEKLRSMDGVIDTFLWQVDKWDFIINPDEMLKYINTIRADDPINDKEWKDQYEKLMNAFICAC